ncbi:MAG TPA: Ezrin/radixin/moesin family protein [Cytophagaceae bacterium]
MKRHLLIVLILIFSASTAGWAQKKSKEEKALEKEWAKKLKSLTPMQYKDLLEQKESLSAELSECTNQSGELRSQLNDSRDQVAKKDAEIAQLKAQLENGGSSNTSTASSSGSSKSGAKKSSVHPGVVFKVQIGSFRNKDLTKYFDNNPNFSGEVDKDGTKKYTLGVFEDYWEADRFKKALREMGVKDAWIVAYKDGNRVNIKDVLEGAL